MAKIGNRNGNNKRNMKVKDFINELQQLDQDKNIWVMYDPPYGLKEPKAKHLVGDYMSAYADMYDEVAVGDYAIICGG